MTPDTWKSADPLKLTETENGDSELINISGADPGYDVQCDWVIKAGEDPAAKMDQVSATFPTTPTPTVVKFHVVDVTTENLGGKPAKQSVKLKNRESMTYV